MSKQSKILNRWRSRTDRYQEQLVRDCGWLKLSVKETKRRTYYYVTISHPPIDSRVRNSVIRFFDPGNNRMTPGFTFGIYLKWRFRSLKTAEELLTLALIKWGERDWYEKIF